MTFNKQLLELIRHLNCVDELITGTARGGFKIRRGRLRPFPSGSDKLSWFHIEGSMLNDGLYIRGEDTLKDEVFEGVVRILRIEPHLIALAKEILEFNQKNAPTLKSSERFGTYSYTNAARADGKPAGWAEVFASRLRPYKRMFSRVRV
ncbi:MAG: hypothetical protein FWE24_09115 [Defluviitaleaceae bacterium]|nr:hypothetical protein [Defluviitaleaceae bacterium]